MVKKNIYIYIIVKKNVRMISKKNLRHIGNFFVLGCMCDWFKKIDLRKLFISYFILFVYIYILSSIISNNYVA